MNVTLNARNVVKDDFRSERGNSKNIQNKNKFFFHTSAKKTSFFTFFFLINKPGILRGEVNIFLAGGLRSGEGHFQS